MSKFKKREKHEGIFGQMSKNTKIYKPNFYDDEGVFGRKRIILVERMNLRKHEDMKATLFMDKLTKMLEEVNEAQVERGGGPANWIVTSGVVARALDNLPDFLTEEDEDEENEELD